MGISVGSGVGVAVGACVDSYQAQDKPCVLIVRMFGLNLSKNIQMWVLPWVIPRATVWGPRLVPASISVDAKSTGLADRLTHSFLLTYR